MKCITCGNLIPDASNVCPYCNSKVEPSASATPVFNTNEGNSVIPNTPSQPVLPQDQNMVNTPVAPVTPTENVQPMQSETLSVTPVESTPVAPVQNVEVSVQPATPVTQTSVTEPMSVAPAMNSINPQGEVVDGTKIGSSLPPKEKKKKKKGMIIGLVVALVVLLIGGLAVFAYFYEFKSADKRLEAVVTNLMSFTSSFNNATEKASGKYNVDVKLSSGDTTMSGALKGTYAVDLENRIMDYTFDLESLNLGQELVNQPINLELYYNDSKVYVLLQNFYDNYIYDEVPQVEEILSTVQDSEINYAIVLNAIRNATVVGTKALTKTQTVEDVTINGTKKKTNVVKIVMTAQNQRAFTNSFVRNLANNTSFIAEMAKISDYSEAELKENLLATLEDVEYENNSSSIEVYTALMGNTLDGIKMNIVDEDESYILEIYPVTNGYGLKVKEGTNSVLEGTFVESKKVTSTTRENTMNYNVTLFQEGTSYKLELVLSVIDDINPKVEKVNVKNSINRMYLTAADKQLIKQKASEMGTIGLYLPSILDLYLGPSEVTDPNLLTEADADQTKCTLVTNCTASTIEGYSICQNQQTAENVICNNAWLTY